MKVKRRDILLFLLQFIPLLALFAWIYPRILPGYARAVVSVANPILEARTPSMSISVKRQGALEVEIFPGTEKSQIYIRGQTADSIFVSLLLFPSLFLATPMPIVRRLELFAVGMLALFLFHALCLTLVFHALYCNDTEGSRLCAVIYTGVLKSGQIGGLALWAMFSWSFWIPGALGPTPLLADGSVDPRIGRNARCPCGSGRKYKNCCGSIRA